MGIVSKHKPPRLERIADFYNSTWSIYHYKRRDGDWSWFIMSGNGNKLANSGEGYKNHSDMMKVLERLFPNTKWMRVSWDLG